DYYCATNYGSGTSWQFIF
nr:immunoglobulin light chain junction region [Macaca mulatta]MOX17780.1 immunoglobulin light chain junction region [Macaca mulatta]MOX18775.1 immunoglobulin light chain junction region [Macaca mulatta]MOX19031.1 immunoglobulin light chain junction region [Macaca mulatta]MOX19745.1 immunoglobulin light chain junction region [Macaca mulatta]